MGGLIVENYSGGKELSFTIAGKTYTVNKAPTSEEKRQGKVFNQVKIFLPPGQYTFSFSYPTGGSNLHCDRLNGCTVTIKIGEFAGVGIQ